MSTSDRGLELDVTVDVGDFTLTAQLDVGPGGILAVLGPNGSGKSTLLAAIAGRLTPSRGYVRAGGRDLVNAGPGPRTNVPLERRRVGLLGQEPLLFPHLSALENVAFGPRAQGRPAREARDEAARLLDSVGLGGFASRRPTGLSGGQQQRVAIARTLAARPEVLLLDEPFTALDVETAAQMRRLVAAQRDEHGLPTLLVTHDPLDAIVLADRAAILHDGRIAQVGPVPEVLGHPRTAFIAALAGVNLVNGAATADGAVLADGAAPSADVASPRLLLRGEGDAPPPGAGASAVFSPGAVHARTAPADAGPAVANRWTGTVALLEATPGGVRITTAEHPGIAVDVPSAAAVGLDLDTGSRLEFEVSAADVSVRPHP
ncbi:sulfate/molybdate ABC transporter ATP-binding protein [Agromyces sp. NPDC058136]|uniref:sulfate/molybdate ABC transporter ATP-binding protein n=1 Tax=Agromyces sp. NPDC058136 TaxID=3346354 RepID=UPI0036D82323